MLRVILLIGYFSIIGLYCIAQPAYRQIVIDEIMADPSPSVGLPAVEWIELRNISGVSINLRGWRIGNGITGTVSGTMESFVLQPDSCVIICSTSALPVLTGFGKVIHVTSFPALNNDTGTIFLRSPDGTTIHTVSYNSEWYDNEIKKDGGWTLEMIDPANPCGCSDNWKASVSNIGGTPGKINSVNGINKDEIPPSLLYGFTSDSVHFTLVFDEPLDSISASLFNNYALSDGMITIKAIPIGPSFQKVSLEVKHPFQSGKIYHVTLHQIRDCVGNEIGSSNACKLGQFSNADSQDIIINEVLFHPKPNGTDYVELYNKSSKIINLKNILLANRAASGMVSSFKNISQENYPLFPEMYVVVTTHPKTIQNQYLVKHPEALITMGSMPSYSNDKGNVVLLNHAGTIIDELSYNAAWHFPLIDNKEGIALERININKKTNDPDNWTSAAATSGYGTPTYQNSQFGSDYQLQGTIKIIPELFSPDNDGRDDFAMIYFQFPEPGYIVNIIIYDSWGRVVKYKEKNTICGKEGSFRWDGLNEQQTKVPIGIYFVYTEAFNLKGKKKYFKNMVAVGRQL